MLIRDLAALVTIGLASMFVWNGSANAMPMYLNDQHITVSLLSPASLTGGTVANAIDAASPSATDLHTQSSHVWVSGGDLTLRFDLGMEYDLESFLFWNYFSESFDVDSVTLRFFDEGNADVGSFDTLLALGTNPATAEVFPLVHQNVRYVNAELFGTNDQVDFQNIGFIGTPVPEPSTALLLGVGLAATAWVRPRRPAADQSGNPSILGGG